MSPIFKSEDLKNEIFSVSSPKIFLIFSLSKSKNQSLKPGIGERVPKFLILGNSSCIS